MRIWVENGIVWFDPWWLVFSVVIGPYLIAIAIAGVWVLWKSR